jgi:hypothetical protein
VTIDAPEDGAVSYARLAEPPIQGRHGTGTTTAAERNSDCPARTDLVRLGAADMDDNTFRVALDVTDVKRDQFRPAKRSGESDEQQSPVAHVFGPFPQAIDKPPNIHTKQGLCLPLGDAEGSLDPTRCRTDERGSGRILEAHCLVRSGNRNKSTAECRDT